jgi:hypothetical protein
MAKLPGFMFYPGDWKKDPELSVCSTFARGLLIEVMCFAFECRERGVMTINGRPATREEIAASCRGVEPNKVDGIDELVRNGVIKVYDPSNPKDDDVQQYLAQHVTVSGPVLYLARLVRDEYIRNVRAEAGALAHRGKQITSKTSAKSEQNTPQSGEQKPSKTNFAPENEIENELDDFSLTSEETSKVRIPLPTDFKVTPKMKEWFETRRFEQFGGNPFSIDMGMQTEMFLNDARTHGRTHINWKRAWCNWMLRAEEYKQERAQKNNRGSNGNGSSNGNSKGKSSLARFVR